MIKTFETFKNTFYDDDIKEYEKFVGSLTYDNYFISFNNAKTTNTSYIKVINKENGITLLTIRLSDHEPNKAHRELENNVYDFNYTNLNKNIDEIKFIIDRDIKDVEDSNINIQKFKDNKIGDIIKVENSNWEILKIYDKTVRLRNLTPTTVTLNGINNFKYINNNNYVKEYNLARNTTLKNEQLPDNYKLVDENNPTSRFDVKHFIFEYTFYDEVEFYINYILKNS